MTGIEAFTSITFLECFFNQITTLDLGANSQLTLLNCQNNAISNLILPSSIVDVSCQNNQIGTLDLSALSNLVSLEASNNNLTSISTANTVLLESLYIGDNQLSTLDVSSNPELFYLGCENNNLSLLNYANGNNATVINGPFGPETSFLNATGNPNLFCIQHDSGYAPSTNSQWLKDPSATFSDNCNLSIDDVSHASIKLSISPNPVSDMLNIEIERGEIKSVSIYSMIGKKIIETKAKSIDLTNLPTGLYLIIVDINGNKYSSKFIKQ